MIVNNKSKNTFCNKDTNAKIRNTTLLTIILLNESLILHNLRDTKEEIQNVMIKEKPVAIEAPSAPYFGTSHQLPNTLTIVEIM